MHLVLGGILGFDWAERTDPYVECDGNALHTVVLQLRQQLRREMEPGCRGRHRAGHARVNGLVSFSVDRLVITLEIRWKRDTPVLLERDEHRRRSHEPYDASSSRARSHDLDLEVVGHYDAPTRLELSTRTHEGFPRDRVRGVGVSRRAEEQDLGGSSRRLAAEETPGQDPALVDHEHVPRADQLPEVAEAQVTESLLRSGSFVSRAVRRVPAARPTPDHEQPTRVASLRRIARDAARRQDIVVVGDARASRRARVGSPAHSLKKEDWAPPVRSSGSA